MLTFTFRLIEDVASLPFTGFQLRRIMTCFVIFTAPPFNYFPREESCSHRSSCPPLGERGAAGDTSAASEYRPFLHFGDPTNSLALLAQLLPAFPVFFSPALSPFFNGISAQSTPGARCIQRSSNDTPNWQRQPGYHQLKAIRRGTKRKKEENGG